MNESILSAPGSSAILSSQSKGNGFNPTNVVGNFMKGSKMED